MHQEDSSHAGLEKISGQSVGIGFRYTNGVRLYVAHDGEWLDISNQQVMPCKKYLAKAFHWFSGSPRFQKR